MFPQIKFDNSIHRDIVKYMKPLTPHELTILIHLLQLIGNNEKLNEQVLDHCGCTTDDLDALHDKLGEMAG